MSSKPIGMFDSGFGGLTVARATIDLLPAEDLIYLGDTARYPYGPRPLEQVTEFSTEIARFLIDTYDIKLLVVACNTATAAALGHLKSTLSVPVVGVIEPGALAVVRASSSGHFGVIGTVGTISSGVYDRVLTEIDPKSSVVSCACPGLVEFVERGVTQGPEVDLLARRLLAPIVAADIDALLLGCTHYPYLARVISDVVGREVVLVSSADETAFALAEQLDLLGLRNPNPDHVGQHQFVSSGDVRAFTKVGCQLLGPELVGAELWRPPSSS